MTDEQKAWIDNASYETLLRRWRHGSPGDAMFQGATGEYFRDALERKRPGDSEHTATSKRIGW